MSLFTSTHFASASASGTDWRDTSKNVLEKLESIKGDPDYFNLGFLYVSDHLADDVTSILNLFKSVLKVENWVGSVGMGVVGCGESFIDEPAISAMVGRFPAGGFCVFPETDDDAEDSGYDLEPQKNLKAWLGEHDPMLAIVHGDPMAEQDPQELLVKLGEASNSFLVGGFTSSRSHHYQIANGVISNSLSGVFFADNVAVSTAVSQGCEPISDFRTITKADDFTILSLDDQKALDVFQDDLRRLAAKRLGKKPEEFMSELVSLESSDQIPEEFKNLFQGQVHVALPLSQSDQKDYLVRNIIGIDPDEGSISISEGVETGKNVLFVERDNDTVVSDLRQTLEKLKERVISERGAFEPKAAFYVSCIARGFKEDPSEQDEMEVVRDIIGKVPLTGFYAGGEINNARLYGYTGILTLFF